MEEALSFHVTELTKTRADYDSLYEKFKISNTLIEEKEKLHEQKLLSLELSSKKKTEKYLKKIFEQNLIIKAYVDNKEKFENDVKILEEAAALLEERETTYLNKINDLKNDIMNKDNSINTLNITINNLKQKLDSAISDNEHFQNVLKNDMVPKMTYDILMANTSKLNNDIENYQKLIEHEMIPKGTYNDIILLILTILTANYNVLQNTISKFTADIENYQNVIKNEMVPKTNYDILQNGVSNLQADIENYQDIINNEMVALSDYMSLKSDIEYYQRTIANDMVSKNSYEDLHGKYEELLAIYENDTQELITRIESEREDLKSAQNLCNTLDNKCSELQNQMKNMVPVEEYEKMKQLLQQALEEKRVAEESANIINKMRDGYLNDVNEAEARTASLKGRVERSERELRDSAAREEKMKVTINEIELELEALNEEYTKMQERCLGLENSKASLLTQLGNIKLNSRREAEVRTQLNNTIQELEKQSKDDQLKFKEQFNEANANFGVLAKELEAKIHDREAQVDKYRNTIKENDTKNENIVSELKSKIKSIKTEKLKIEEELQKQLISKDEEIAKKDDHISILGSAVKDLERSKGLLEDDSDIQKKFIEDLLRKYSSQGKSFNEMKQQLDFAEKVNADLKAQIHVYQVQLEEIRLTALEELGEIEDESTVQYNANQNNHRAVKLSSPIYANMIPVKSENNEDSFTKTTSPNSISQLTATTTNVSVITNNIADTESKISPNSKFDLPTPTHLNIANDDISNHDHIHYDNDCDDDKDAPIREDDKDQETKNDNREFKTYDAEVNSDTAVESNSELAIAVAKTPSSIKSNKSAKSSKSTDRSYKTNKSSSSSAFSKLGTAEKIELKQIEKRLNEFKKLVR